MRSSVERLPLPAYDCASLGEIARHISLLQLPHEKYLENFRAGHFHFLNRCVDFSENGGEVDWTVDLDEGTNPLWKLNLYYVGYLVPMLASGNVEDLNRAVALLAEMENANHWTLRNAFRECWNPYAVSHRITNVLCGISLYLKAGGELSAEQSRKISQHVRLCVRMLLDNLEYELQFNHLLKNFTALAVYAAAVGQPVPELSFLESELSKTIKQNVLSDGCHSELSPMYHALSLLDFRVLKAASIWSPQFDNLLDTTIKSMEHALRVLSHPDGDVSLFNDAWLGESPPARLLVDLPPMPGATRLGDAGYIRLEGPREAIIFDCGACGPDLNPGHAHADFLSIEASVDSKRLLVDFGTPTYSAGELRDKCRSASSHNGPAVFGAEPIEFWLSFRVGRRGYAKPITSEKINGFMPLWCAGVQDGYSFMGVTVKRYIGMVPGRCFALVDIWQGSPKSREFTNLRIPHNWLVTGTPEKGEARIVDGNTDVRLVCPAGIMTNISQDCWYPEFNLPSPATVVTVSPTISGDLRYLAVLFLYDQGAVDQLDFGALVQTLSHV